VALRPGSSAAVSLGAVDERDAVPDAFATGKPERFGHGLDGVAVSCSYMALRRYAACVKSGTKRWISWLLALVAAVVAFVVAFVPLRDREEAIALSLAAAAASAYTVLTYLLARRATDQSATLARQLDVQRAALEEQREALQETRKQFAAQVELASRSLDAATAAVIEAARARADEQAPRVFALLEAPAWAPNVDRTRSRMPGADELRLLDPKSKHASSDDPNQEFYFDQDKDHFLWLLTRGLLINEGKGTARVRLDGEAQFIAGTSPFTGEREIATPPAVGTPQHREYLLRPGEVALFEWGYGHRLADWADAYENPNRPDRSGRCFLTVTVFDFQENGVVDHIYVELSGRPIEPIPGKTAAWRLTRNPSEALGTSIYPTRRTYRNEPRDDQPPPWVQQQQGASPDD